MDVATAIVRRVPRTRTVDLDQPWAWLGAGWHDLRQVPMVSLLYGAVYAGLGFAFSTLMWVEGVLYLSLPIAAMFTFLGPIAAVGLYRISRDLAEGRPVRLGASLAAFHVNGGQIALMGVALMLLALAWMQMAFLLFMMFFGQSAMAPEAWVMIDHIFTSANLGFLVIGTVSGAILALFAFALSVVSLPLLFDHEEANVIEAILTSLHVVRDNFWAMALWAWLIALFIAGGIATGYVGLVVTLPLIGHASWHAYKDLVAWDDRDD